jgi:hypothetical protein
MNFSKKLRIQYDFKKYKLYFGCKKFSKSRLSIAFVGRLVPAANNG